MLELPDDLEFLPMEFKLDPPASFSKLPSGMFWIRVVVLSLAVSCWSSLSSLINRSSAMSRPVGSSSRVVELDLDLVGPLLWLEVLLRPAGLPDLGLPDKENESLLDVVFFCPADHAKEAVAQAPPFGALYLSTSLLNNAFICRIM